MNEDMMQGEGRDLGGKVQETVGDLTGDRSMQADGIGNQLSGKAQKLAGGVRDAVAEGATPWIDRTRAFVQARPYASAALAGVLGIALLNTLRGRR